MTSEIPSCAWSKRLDFTLSPESLHTSSRPPPLEIVSLLPVAYRVANYLSQERNAHREPIFDLNFTLGGMEPPQTGPYNGVPLGGLGGGSIGRGYRGDFRRWSLHPGRYVHKIVLGNQFSVRVERNGVIHSQVLSTFDYDLSRNMDTWKWSLKASTAEYYALFPRAWTVYKEPVPGVNVIIRQISPVIPHSYSDASLPVSVFSVEVENIGDGDANISIMFTFENSHGEVDSLVHNQPHATFDTETISSIRSQGVCMAKHKFYKTTERKNNVDVVRTLFDQCSISIASTVDPIFSEHEKDTSKGSLTTCDKFIVSETVVPGEEDVRDASAALLWERFHRTGEIGSFSHLKDYYSEEAEVASAVCLKKTIKSKETSIFPFVVSWDVPVARFGSGKGAERYYTQFFGKNGLNSPAICAYALSQCESWEKRIIEWQKPVLDDTTLPAYYKCLLFNELYYLVDGGTIWAVAKEEELPERLDTHITIDIENGLRDSALLDSTQSLNIHSEEDVQYAGVESDIPVTSSETCLIADTIMSKTGKIYGVTQAQLDRHMETHQFLRVTAESLLQHDVKVRSSEGLQNICGRFLYLEGHEYLMYNTYDVHFYASYSIIKLWPMIELSIQRDYGIAVYLEDLDVRKMLGNGANCIRKAKGFVPHDLGSPSEDPWNKVNIYNFQDVCNWKDLGPKFVLQVYRDYVHTKAVGFCRDLYPIVIDIMTYTERFDLDGDGMIENSGFPDQTYDIWVAKGVHAYCGGLWVCACFAAASMAALLRDHKNMEKFSNLGSRAREVYNNELWNGKYLNYDNSTSYHHDSIMSDMLAGQWYALECDLPHVVTTARALSCFRAIFDNNVVKFGEGKWKGAVNGYRPEGGVDNSCIQSREVWPGTTYGLAAAMILTSGARTIDSTMTFLLDKKLYAPEGNGVVELLPDEKKELMRMAMLTAQGIYDAGWVEYGYWFVTPEGWEQDGCYRSKGYMRPLAVWAMQSAIDKINKVT